MKTGELKRFMEGHEGVVVAYLFGSYARGGVGPLSDVDVAVYLDEHLSKSERFDFRLRMINETSSILKTDRVDVVVMNDAPITLNHEIIKNGKVLVAKDTGKKVEMETKILSRYLDRIYYERRSLNQFLERILERGGL